MMRESDQRLFDGPHVPRRETPIDPQGAEVEDAVPIDATVAVHVGIDVGEDEVPDRTEDRFPSVESGVPGQGDGAELGALAEQEDDVIEIVLGFEVEDRRRKPVLFEDGRGR
jgi:hypothetical protein